MQSGAQDSPVDVARELMSTREVADYLRIKERKVYDLVRSKQIPCTRVGGKWLFPRKLIDQWMAERTDYATVSREPRRAPPLIVAGSHDPLLDWALRESRSGLAVQTGGSLDGLKRLAAGEAVLAGLHVLGLDQATYNIDAVKEALQGEPIVVLHWVAREQGLLVRSADARRIRTLEEAVGTRARMIMRQPESGSQILLGYLLPRVGLKFADVVRAPEIALNETDLGQAVAEKRADVGLGLRTVARQFGLEFQPLHRERFDVVMRQSDYFEPPLQKLFAFARTPAFARRAAEFGGYNIEGLGEVIYKGE
jgi:putative molybdopterin biosynthesis protein